MKDLELKDGMKVLIKRWKKMKKEYGLSKDGTYIKTIPYFVKSMKYLCNTVCTVKVSDVDDFANISYKVLDSECGYWNISPQMVEAVICPKPSEEPEQKESYPIFKKSKITNIIVKFTDLTRGEVVFDHKQRYQSGFIEDWVEHTDTVNWEDVPYDSEKGFWHGQPVWCWYTQEKCTRQLRFYSATTNSTFSFSGTVSGIPFTNYEAVKPEHYEDWMYEAYQTLEGI